MRQNMHLVIPNPKAHPRDRARVLRATALVDEINASPDAKQLDPTGTSIAVHVASEWLGKARGFEAEWDELDPVAFARAVPAIVLGNRRFADAILLALACALDWMADHGRIHRDVANHCIDVFAANVRPPTPPKKRRMIPRTRRFHRNWS